MRRLIFFLIVVVAGSYLLRVYGQPMCFRTAEEEAEKQTEMMQHELELTQAQRDTIYLINLKYAKARRISNTRAEMLARITKKTEELKGVLTAEQYHQYMNCQLENGNKRVVPVIRKQPVAADSGSIENSTLQGS